MNYRLTPAILEIKRASVDATGHFTGYASTWHDEPDHDGDIIIKNAFSNAIRKHKQAGTMPAMLWSHLHQEVIGKWLSMEEDNHGLLMTGKLTLETERGKGAHALLRDDAIYLSIGYAVAKGGATRTGDIRRIREIGRLGEVSLVAMPSDTTARVISKQARPESRKEFEHLLRNAAGLSAREAKRAVTAVRNEHDLDPVIEKIRDTLECYERGEI